MAIREIVTFGFGPQSPVNFIPTIGFGLASLSPPSGGPGIEYVWTGDRLHHAWKGDRLRYAWIGDRLYYQGGEEL